jgi:hypothetical protein
MRTDMGEPPLSRHLRGQGPADLTASPRPCASPVVRGSARPAAAGAGGDGVRPLPRRCCSARDTGHESRACRGFRSRRQGEATSGPVGVPPLREERASRATFGRRPLWTRTTRLDRGVRTLASPWRSGSAVTLPLKRPRVAGRRSRRSSAPGEAFRWSPRRRRPSAGAPRDRVPRPVRARCGRSEALAGGAEPLRWRRVSLAGERAE